MTKTSLKAHNPWIDPHVVLHHSLAISIKIPSMLCHLLMDLIDRPWEIGNLTAFNVTILGPSFSTEAIH